METGKKVRIGITGESGFIGRHLAGMARVTPCFQHVPFEKRFFDNSAELTRFAGECDVIVHLAAVSRAENGESLYNTNMALVRSLAEAALRCEHVPGICFGSTVQIHKQLPYHASKRDGAAFLKQALAGRSWVINMLMPNAFGPYSRPFYNSVISTFCFMAASGKTPEQIADVSVELIHVGTLCSRILALAAEGIAEQKTRDAIIPFQYRESLPEIWEKLQEWAGLSGKNLPCPGTSFEQDLRQAFVSYRDALSPCSFPSSAVQNKKLVMSRIL